MKSFTNEDLIINRKKWATRLSPVAMIMLVGGLVTNFMSLQQQDPSTLSLFFYTTIFLLGGGFITSTISAQLVNHWVKEPRADQHLENILQSFDNKHVLFNYTTDAPHVLLTPTKIYSITVKGHDGKISVNKNRWRRAFSWGRLLRAFMDEGLGNPSADALQHADKLRNKLHNALDEQADGITVLPLVVFTDPKVELTVEDPEVPVMKGGKLKTFIRENTRGSAINSEKRQKIAQFLAGETK